MRKSAIMLVMAIWSCWATAQETHYEDFTLTWTRVSAPGKESRKQMLSCNGATSHNDYLGLPFVVASFPVNTYGEALATISNEVYEEEPNTESIFNQHLIGEEPVVISSVNIARKRHFAQAQVMPLRKSPINGKLEKLISFRVTITHRPLPAPTVNVLRNAPNSVLRNGKIYKVEISETGLHKIDFAMLQGMGVNMSGLDPRKIQIFGNIGGMVPENLAVSRPDDLVENPVFIQGEADGRFDNGDYILFYAQDGHRWVRDQATAFFNRETNTYSDKNYYFIKIGDDNGLRVSDAPVLSNPTYTTDSYDFIAHHENESVNIFQIEGVHEPSGSLWCGESFRFNPSQNFSLTIPNPVVSEQATLEAQVVGRAVGTSSSFALKVNNNTVLTIPIQTVGTGTYDLYARLNKGRGTFSTTNGSVPINLTMAAPNSSMAGWLDYITLNGRSHLDFQGRGGQMAFRDSRSVGNAVAEYQLSNINSNTIVWDVTDLNAIKKLTITDNNSILASAMELREFVTFDGSSFKTPIAKGEVANQDLHVMAAPDMLVVCHPSLEQAANSLATHRRAFDNYTVEVVSIHQIYNEFSSGRQDVGAIRDFAKLLYDKDPVKFKYLLLFGDASFDFKDISLSAQQNSNLVPTYETPESLDPIRTYATDDFFALMDPNELAYDQSSAMDIAVGRIPAKTNAEGMDVVNKIIHYETNPVVLSDWKNRLTFIADDEDSALHMRDADGFTVYLKSNYPTYNINKLYMDAFRQVSTSGGDRYPDCTQSLMSDIFRGTSVVNFTGHGGWNGWTQERVLQMQEIETMDNFNSLPLFITATCSFAPYDDAEVVTAGERLLLKSDGGAIALLSTSRVVYASANQRLVNEVFERIFQRVQPGSLPEPIGEVMRTAKNSAGTQSGNTRKFAMFGDPSMRLAYPQYYVLTDSINGVLATAATDTLRALQPVRMTGRIVDYLGNTLTNFNGTVSPTLFDKPVNVTSLANDPLNPRFTFSLQQNIIYRGRASVSNGRFSFNFVMPQDINYVPGAGKLSYYAEDGIRKEAADHLTGSGLVIGGTYANAAIDNQGPRVRVYMNDDNFISGGLTDKDPVLLAKLEDENGINATGNSIGHDITAVLDANTQSPIVLNGYYQTEINDFKRGRVRYPMRNLAEGRHTITVKAWDTYNNPGEGSTEFVVSSKAEIALEHVLNYPNPFTTNTEFMFNHNMPGMTMDVQVQIFTVGGKLIKTINQTVTPEGYVVRGLDWDGKDEHGDSIGRGTYVYKVSVSARGSDSKTYKASQFEKLVILK